MLENKRVLVTGADGFIGSHLTELLVGKCKHIRAFSQYNAQNSWGWIEDMDTEIKKEIEVVTGDIRDRGSVADSMKDVDIVFHLAALIGIPYSYIAPYSYVDTNITGTLNILEQARHQNCDRVLVTSTSEVYGTAQYIPIDEKHPFQGQSPYSASKIGADRISESYYRSFEVPVVIVRPFNTYGPRQSARAVIPTVITQLLSGANQIKMGSLTPTRDLVFVKDTAQGFAELAVAPDAIGREINIATGNEISIGELAQAIVHQINPDAKIICDEQRIRPVNSEVERLLGCTKLLKKVTNWSPSTSIEDGLGQTIAWFSAENRLQKYKPEIYNV